ncbi:pannexin 10 [Elysia marginata]|uniref:Pannexin 10 n=1 Tax=Elysia marginata TaxID=1093978 RepID=A0AAV4EL19_9GAST|nr:pannexin 10 [Elysia marginata]
MGILRGSRGEDKVDYYLHTGSVLFLLFLAIVTWLLPLSPHLQPQTQPSNLVVTSQTAAQPQPRPIFKTSCWCPQEFTHPMVAYVEATCGGAYSLALQGIEPHNDNVGASLFSIPFDRPIPIDWNDQNGFKFKPVIRNISDSETKQDKDQLPTIRDSEKEENTDDVWHFIHIKTPFVLFLLAVCLKIPHVVWTLLSSLIGGINIDQTLTSAKAGSRLDHESRRQLYRDLAVATAEKVRVCSWRAGSLYLLLKVLMCVAVIAELLVVHGSLLPQAKSLEDKLHKVVVYYVVVVVVVEVVHYVVVVIVVVVVVVVVAVVVVVVVVVVLPCINEREIQYRSHIIMVYIDCRY